MAYKTIIVHCDASKPVPHRLAIATELAQRFDATLVGAHARPPFEMPGFLEDGTTTASLVEAFEEDQRVEQAEARAAFDKVAKGKNLHVDWRSMAGHVANVLTANGRHADLLILGQAGSHDSYATPSNLPEAVALATGRPMLVVPHVGASQPVGKNVMLCWNASRESARAASDALPFLKAAKQVTVLVVDPEVSPAAHGEEPGADVAAWLARHGVKVTVQREGAADTDVGNIILSRAADLDVDLIVMGIYGHSRLREMVLGGVSRTLLSSMTVPVLMSH